MGMLNTSARCSFIMEHGKACHSLIFHLSNKYRHTLHIGNGPWLKCLDRMYNKLWSFHDPLVINPVVTNLYMGGMSGCDINLLFLQAFDPMVTEGLGFAGILDGLLVVHLFPFVSKVETLLMHELTAFLRSNLILQKICLLAYWLQGHTFIKRRWGLGWKSSLYPSWDSSSWAYNDDHPDETNLKRRVAKQ